MKILKFNEYSFFVKTYFLGTFISKFIPTKMFLVSNMRSFYIRFEI